MDKSQDTVNQSGYPLQIHLQDLIEKTKIDHNWSVELSEHRWINNRSNEDGYIDLVLKNSSIHIKLVIECKRIIGKWNFIISSENPFPTNDSKALSINYKTFKYSWVKFVCGPGSYEASFCVMEKEDGNKDSRTLEKIANDLLLSLEYFAIEETESLRLLYQDNPPYENNKFYIPIIITTAELNAFKFDPQKFDLKTGQVIDSKSEVVPYIRFKKNLSSHIEFDNTNKYFTLRDLNQEHDRFVFVVHAENIIEFLKDLRF